MVAFEKFGQHQPLNRQAERFAREGVELSLSTLADLVGHATVALEPLHALIAQHVRAADRLHGDDTTVPLLVRGGTRTARLWTYVRLGPAQPRGMAWKGAGGWLILSQSRQVNFSRTVWITFHCRGITSSVSVTSSPIFTIRDDPQQLQLVGASTTTRSRGRCSGNGLRTGRRWKPSTVVVFAAAASAAISSSVAAASSSSSWSSSCSISRARRSDLWPYCSRPASIDPAALARLLPVLEGT